MRGIKTFPLRMERQCANACRVAQWLAAHPRVERVYFPATRIHTACSRNQSSRSVRSFTRQAVRFTSMART